MNIDVHAHFISRNCLAAGIDKDKPYIPALSTDKNGREIMVFGGQKRTEKYFGLESRIKDMDAMGVDIQVLSLIPNLLYFDLKAEDFLWFCQRQNEELSRIVKQYPSRFAGMAALPLQEPRVALSELDRAINKLGLKGVEILSFVNDKELDDPTLEPFYREIEILDVPIFIHPGVRPGKRKKYFLGNLVEHPAETTMAAGHLIFGGVLEKFPKLKFCLAHGGGFLPYIQGRFEHGYNNQTAPREVITKPPSHYVPFLYCDTITHSIPILEFLVASMGADKVILGTDYPAEMSDAQPVDHVKSLSISEEDKQKILGGNAARIFGL